MLGQGKARLAGVANSSKARDTETTVQRESAEYGKGINGGERR